MTATLVTRKKSLARGKCRNQANAKEGGRKAEDRPAGKKTLNAEILKSVTIDVKASAEY